MNETGGACSTVVVGTDSAIMRSPVETSLDVVQREGADRLVVHTTG